MADPTTKTFPQLVQGQAAAVQARAAGLVDFSVGAIVRAIAEATAGVVLWLQGLILVLLATTRAATSTGADLDSWVADWAGAPTSADAVQISRLPALAASGSVTFSRASTTSSASIPVGATVQTLDGSQSYAVVADTANSAFNAGLNSYVMAISVANVTVPVQGQAAGAAGNAVVGAINTITSAIPGVDTVTNASALTNGSDAESDAAFRVRFRNWVAVVGKGTAAAIRGAVSNLQQGVTAKVIEQLNHDGSSHPGYFFVLVDDGTGSPSSDLLNAAGSATDATRAAGIPFNVYAPTVVTIDVSATLVTGATADHALAIVAATAALTAYLNTIPIGQNVYISRVWQILQDSAASILEVTGLTVNSGTTDVTISSVSVAKAGTISIS